MKHLCITHLIPFQWEYPSLACSLLLFLTALLPSSTALAQVNWKDRPVTLAKFDQKNSSIARPARTDFTVVVWEDYREGTNLADIYAQKIDNVTGVPMWSPIDGVPVCLASENQLNPRAAYDSLGNVIIVWEDYRNAFFDLGDWQNVKIYANALEVASGSILPNWDPNYEGVPICGNASGAGDSGPRGRDPRIVGTREGAFITWSDYRVAYYDSLLFVWRNRHVYEQYVRSVESPVIGWPSNGIQIDQSPIDAVNPEIVLDNAYAPYNDPYLGCVVVFQDRYSVDSNRYSLQAVRYDKDQNLLHGPSVIAPVSLPITQRHHRLKATGGDLPGNICQNGIANLGTVVVWEEDNTWSSEESGIHLALLDSTMMTVLQTDLETNQPGQRQRPKVTVLDEPIPDSSYAIVAWEREDGAPNGLDVMANYVNLLTGRKYYQDPEDIGAWSGDQNQIDLDITGSMQYPHVYFGWVDNRDGDADIYYQDVELSGFTELKSNGGWPVTKAHRERISLEVGKDVFVFADRRRDDIPSDTTTDLNIYCQKPGEECDQPTDMRWRDVYVGLERTSRVTGYRGATDETGAHYLIYTAPTDWANPQSTQGVFVQKIDQYGVPRWKNNGVLLSNLNYRASGPDIAQDGDGGAYVVWQENSGPTGTGYVARILYSGEIAWTQSIANADCDLWLRVAPKESRYLPVNPTADIVSGCYTVYRDSTNGSYTLVEWSDAGVAVSSRGRAENTYRDPILKSDYADGTYLAYTNTVDVKLWWNNPLSLEKRPQFLGGVPSAGFDMAVDLASGSHTVSVVQISATSGEIEVVKYLYQTFDRSGEITQRPVGSVFSHPKIVADSMGTPNGAGCFIVWDEEYLVGGYPRHKVHLDRSQDGGNGIVSGMIPKVFGGPNHELTQPTVAIHRNPFAFSSTNPIRKVSVAWKDDYFHTCANDTSIRVTQYDVQGIAYLGSSGKAASPGLLTLHKTQPLLMNAAGTDVSLFWLDSLGNGLSLMGTQLHAESEEVVWAKPTVGSESVQTMTPLALEFYPQPYHLATQSVALITFSIPTEEMVHCMLYDALGREIGSVFEGMAIAGSHTVRFSLSDPTYTLSSGVYMLRLSAGTRTATQRILISF